MSNINIGLTLPAACHRSDWHQDTSDQRHFGTGAEVSISTSAELSGHICTSAEVSYGHFGSK